ncbi:MAG: 16S rRNA (guanine(527)-N(7))-methyltransferase RsmG [Lachnospiraceae bacterium]|nr:16S rRNA (guanine(527)-N(7))-methyltransferase RsmG [Lachnospiraceae bacterium]
MTKNIELDNYKLNSFQKDLDELNILLTENQLRQFMQYYELLVEWNQVMNLTAITEFDEVLKKHFIDSLSLVKACDLSGEQNDISTDISLIDIGTGAGFPGIPLKIVFPNIKVTLMDSLNKRVDFLNEVIAVLGLDEIETIHGRAEDYAKPDLLREKYDLCVSRAVANLSTLSEYCLPYVKIGGKFISYKSEKIIDEIKDAEYAIEILGGKVEDQVSFMLPNSELYRNLFVVTKCTDTPLKYPRKAGMASKKPLTRHAVILRRQKTPPK